MPLIGAPSHVRDDVPVPFDLAKDPTEHKNLAAEQPAKLQELVAVLDELGVGEDRGRLEVLRGISLEVGRGEVMCIIGPSGSGKSTFLRAINHLEKRGVPTVLSTPLLLATKDSLDSIDMRGVRAPEGWKPPSR